VSALHGRGSGDVLDAVVARLPDQPGPSPEPGGPRRVALVGKPNVGKSSLLNRLVGHERALVDAERARLAARLLADLAAAPAVARRVSQIKAVDAHDAAVILNGDPAVVHLGDTAFVARLRSYVELSGALHERVPAIDYVDMRFDNRVYVRPAGRTAARVARGAR
jgi:hypothetical protein